VYRFSVTDAFEWPMTLATSLTGTPDDTSHVAYECRKSWKRSPPADFFWAAPSFPDKGSTKILFWKVRNCARETSEFFPGIQAEAVKRVTESSRPVARVARELGILEGALGNSVAAYRREHAGEEHPSTVRCRGN
jgi:hypothetical protein